MAVQVGSKIPLQYAVLPAVMCDDQAELGACDVARQRHEFLSRCEFVEVWACEVVRSLRHWEGFVYQGLGDTLLGHTSLAAL